MKTVAIIGAGFSGTMAAVHLLSQNETDCRVVLYDPSWQVARGVAYGVASLAFLLNVPAESMSAFPSKPDHFCSWIEKAKLPYQPGDFVPRKVYGDYLSSLLEEASVVSGRLEIQDCAVRSLSRSSERWSLNLSDSRVENADVVLLATGYPRQEFELLNPHTASSYDGIAECKDIALIGSGLTAVDVIEQCSASGYAGSITVLSRSGKFPYVHAALSSIGGEAQFRSLLAKDRLSIAEVLESLRADIVKFGPDRLFHDLRPHTVEIWRKLSLGDKKQFFRHLESPWNRVRHRMPASSAATISRLQSEKRLKLVKGSFQSWQQLDSRKMRVNFRSSGGLAHFDVERIFDCRGPGSSPADNALIANLIQSGVLDLSELKKGVVTDCTGRVPGKDSPPLFVVGPLRREELLETTAVRELRQQALDVSVAILDVCKEASKAGSIMAPDG